MEMLPQYMVSCLLIQYDCQLMISAKEHTYVLKECVSIKSNSKWLRHEKNKNEGTNRFDLRTHHESGRSVTATVTP